MTFNLNDRVLEVVTVSGTGPVTLPGSVLLGYRTFAATLTAGDTTWYTIEDNTSGAWEVGLGTWNGSTLTRTTVYASSNSGSAVNFPGNSCNVFQDLPAQYASQAGTPLDYARWYLRASTPDPSGISGYFLASQDPGTDAQTTQTFALTGTSQTGLLTFVSAPGVPGATIFPFGSALNNIYAYVDGGSAKLNVRIRALHLDGSISEVGSKPSQEFSNTSVAAITWTVDHDPIGSSVDALLPTDRIQFELRCARVSGPTTVNVTVYFGGTTYCSNAGTPYLQTRPDDMYELNVSDFGALGDLYTITDGTVSAGSATLTSTTGGFIAAMVGKPLELTYAPGTAPLITTVATVVNTNTLTMAGTSAVAAGIQYATGALVDNPGTLGNYAPGDQLVLQGGTFTQAGTINVTTTRMRTGTLAIVNPGSLGTSDGYTVLRGMTGDGRFIRASAAVVSGSLDPTSITEIGPGNYLVNPTDLTNEPVTSDRGVVGATVSFNTDPGVLGITTAGSYSVIPADSVATSAGSISGATGATLNMDWGSTGRTAIGTDNLTAISLAMTSAININAAGGRAAVVFPQGNFGLFTGSLPTISQAIIIRGAGIAATQIYMSGGYTGKLFKTSELITSPPIQSSAGPNTMLSRNDIGAGIYDMSLFGNRTASALQTAISFQDRNGALTFENLVINDFGQAITSGDVTGAHTIAYIRESSFWNVRAYDCGFLNYPAVDLSTRGAGDGNNELRFYDFHIVFPRGIGLRIRDINAARGGSRNISFIGLRVEAKPSDSGVNIGDLIQIGDPNSPVGPSQLSFIRSWLVSWPAGYAAIRYMGTTSLARPHDISWIDLNIGGGAPLGVGIAVDAGYNLFHDIKRNAALEAQVTTAAFNIHRRGGKLVGVGSTTSAVVLDALAWPNDGYYVGNVLVISGESRLITAYVGATKTATVGSVQGSPATFSTAPVAGTAYSIQGLVGPFLGFDAYDSDTWEWGLGTGASEIIQDTVTATGVPSGAGLITRALNFNALGINNTGYVFGSTSGTITLASQVAAGTWEWDWPITAGTAGQVLTSQGGAGTAMTWTTPSSSGYAPTVTNTYVASGTIAVTDSIALVNSASNLSMTLAAGGTDGHLIQVKRYGAGTVTLTATIDGGAGSSIVMNSPSIKENVMLAWNAGNSTWLLL